MPNGDITETLYIQDITSSITSHRSHVMSIDRTGRVVLWTHNVPLITALIESLRLPHSINELASKARVDTNVIDKTIKVLSRAHLVREYRHTEHAPTRKTITSMILGICGSIQAAAMLPMAMALKSGIAEEVNVIFTKSARSFTSIRAYIKMGFVVWLEDGEQVGSRTSDCHIDLASTSDICLVAPATAHFISRLAFGTCSDYLSLVALAHRGPVAIAPCMNGLMLRSPAVLRNIDQLRKDGYYLIEPRAGSSRHVSVPDEADLSALGVTANNVCGVLAAIRKATGAGSKLSLDKSPDDFMSSHGHTAAVARSTTGILSTVCDRTRMSRR